MTDQEAKSHVGSLQKIVNDLGKFYEAVEIHVSMRDEEDIKHFTVYTGSSDVRYVMNKERVLAWEEYVRCKAERDQRRDLRDNDEFPD